MLITPTSLKRRRALAAEPPRRWARSAGLLLVIVVVAGTILGVIFGLSRLTPWSVDCRTTQYTYCPQTARELSQQLQKTPIWKQKTIWKEIETQILQREPTFSQADYRLNWLGRGLVILTPATELFPLRWAEQDWLVYDNGTLVKLTAPRYPLVQMASPSAWPQITPPRWSENPDQLALFTHLYTGLKSTAARGQRILVYDWGEIKVFPEGQPPVVVHALDRADIARQLATLQAFFHSSTIDPDATEIDVRFGDIILR